MIIFIHHSVSPYMTALYNKLTETEIPFKVYYLSSPARNRNWNISDFKIKYTHTFLRGWKFYIPGNDHWYFQINLGMWKMLEKDKPQIIVSSGWNFLAAYVAFIYAKLHNIKYVLRCESTKYERNYLRTITLPVVKLLVRNSDLLFAAGSRSKKYLVSLGVSSNVILTAYNTVDNEFFIKEGNKYKNSNFVRKKYSIENSRKVVLYVGQYIKRKGIYPLLEVARKLKDDNVTFILVGYGEENGEMKKYIKNNRLNNVILVGFIKNNEIVKYYKTCDIFILPSLEEVWGLVVNEAMCAGKPVLVSYLAGSSIDLVRNNVNGYIIDPNDTNDMQKKILYLMNNEKQMRNFGDESLKIIKNKVNLNQNIKTIRNMFNKFI